MWIKDNSLVSFNNIKNTLGRGINVYLGSNIANNLCIQNNIIDKTTNAHSIYVNVGGIDTININGNQCDKSFYLYSEKSNVGNVNICNNKFYDMYIDKKLKCANIKLTNTIISNSVDFSPLTSSWTKTSCTSLSDGVQINSWGKILQELKLNKKVENILIDYEIEYSSVNPTTNSDSVRVVVTANGYSKNNNATLSGTNSDKVKINGTIHLLDILGCSSINFEVYNSSNFAGEAFASCTINSISCNIREC